MKNVNEENEAQSEFLGYDVSNELAGSAELLGQWNPFILCPQSVVQKAKVTVDVASAG